jgi:hypothetical protein
MCGRARTGADMKNGGKKIEKWVSKSSWPKPTFYPQQERETYHKV